MWFRKSLKRVKLPNFGKALRPLIPSNNFPVISGWINYSCMVISQWILERGIGNHESKSVLSINSLVNYNAFTVKEQRVNGSYTINFVLRCTLTGFERNYLFRIPSNQITKKKCFFYFEI
uniref:LAGLIDADG endonuclease n=3 Tax=Ceratocystis TaxID=5157 RepID=A0A5C1V9N7_9PEZI|nr:LAGLIDADG endonuclease [Ceratocystis cacaofunesta]YP_009704225.1 LAGLIDADG endonuclease [Ceratocystis fimbriata]YP_009710377.1 LAGLIDADG endonuclease [Ceratocystis albifundus]AFO38134.1 LAGLIDADG endonuclease [Ceratocystis cacaofunesta]QEN73788.1 LAGLIDADG endonuclease [Ceratocystis fimbriata]QFX74879.1 LAGLIDADG endonuclease [Ceratocystis albifundus]